MSNCVHTHHAVRVCMSSEQTGGAVGGRGWRPRPLYNLTAVCSWAPVPVSEQVGEGLCDGAGSHGQRGGHPHSSSAVQPSPPGELRARPPCPLPPRMSVHTAGGGSRSEIALDTSCEVIPTWGLSGRASAGPWGTGEVASAAELSGPRHGLGAASVCGPWWAGQACPQPLDGEGARNGGPAFTQSSTGCGVPPHTPRSRALRVYMHARVCVRLCRRVERGGVSGEGRQWSPLPLPPRAPQPRAGPTLGARGGAGFQKLSGTRPGGWEGAGTSQRPWGKCFGDSE